jgi:transcriptional regulator with PAS, ATPase and Fis domain
LTGSRQEKERTEKEIKEGRGKMKPRGDSCCGQTASAPVLSEWFVGRSPAFIRIKQAAFNVASRRSTVLILGQTGTGKQMLAQYIHRLSPRRRQPFIPVDCLALTETLFESELFGHVKGAFTGAISDSLGFVRAADGGTLFLDEIGDLSPRLQGKLLRLLQEQEVVAVGDIHPHKVDVRVIAATNKNLTDLVSQGAFREDLFFRLGVVILTLPPLRERAEDIPVLADHFLRRQAQLYGETKKTLSPAAAGALLHYSWPGNIRQLSNVIEHAHILTEGEMIEPEALPALLQRSIPECDKEGPPLTLEEIERHAIVHALRQTGHCKAAAARLLHVNIQRLNRLIERLHIPLP